MKRASFFVVGFLLILSLIRIFSGASQPHATSAPLDVQTVWAAWLPFLICVALYGGFIFLTRRKFSVCPPSRDETSAVFGVRLRYSEEDLRLALQLSLQFSKGLAVFPLVLFCMLNVAFSNSVSSGLSRYSWGIAFSGTVLICFVAYRRFLKTASTRAATQSEVAYTLSGEGVAVETATGKSDFKWSAFVRAIETSGHFCIQLLSNQAAFYIVPKRCLSEAECVALHALLSARLELLQGR